VIPVALLLLAQVQSSSPPVYLLRCAIDPERVTSNGKPVAPTSINAEKAVFTLTMAEGAVPIAITPRNLAEERSDLRHLTDGIPRLEGGQVLMDFAYEHPLMVLPPSEPGAPVQSMGRLRTEGLLRLNPRRLAFSFEQTMAVQMDFKIPETSRQDLKIEAKGTCVERAIPAQS